MPDRRWIVLLLTATHLAFAASCSTPEVRRDGLLSPYEITDQSLTLKIGRDSLGIEISLADGGTWRSPPEIEPAMSVWLKGKEISVPLKTAGEVEVLADGRAGGRKIHLRLSNFSQPAAVGIVMDLVAELTVGKDELTFQIRPVKDPAGRLFGVAYPPPILHSGEEKGYTFLPTMQGIAIPSDYAVPLSYSMPWWPDPSPDVSEPWWGGAVYSRACTMAWFGATRGREGYIAIIETPYDATIDLEHPRAGPTMTGVRWRPSRGSLRYPRSIRYAFFRDADHVTLARRYRQHAGSMGFLRSLSSKKGARPAVEGLAGAVLLRADFPRAEDPIVLALASREARKKGIVRAIFRLPAEAAVFSADRADAWKGFTRRMSEGGWLVAAQMDPFGDEAQARGREFAAWPSRQGSIGMMVKSGVILGSSPQERGSRKQPAARTAGLTTWYGGYGRDEVLCPVPRAARMVEALRETARRGIRLGGIHLRGLSQVPLFDCYHTNHPLDKEGCSRSIRKLMRIASDRGHVVYSDEPVDFAFERADLFDRCPYPRARGSQGPTLGIPTPLVAIVYHDAGVVAWDLDTGDDATDQDQFLHAALTGGIGALPIDAEGWLTRRRGGESEESRRRREQGLIDRAKTLAGLHRNVWDRPMVSHEFVRPDGSLQRSRFTGGAVVEADFRTGDLTLRGVDPF